MPDNTQLNTGTGGDVIATDDISGVKFQRVKLALGADGVNDGDVASGNPLPVSGTVTANAGTGSFTVAQATAGNLNATVTGSVGLNAGSNAIGSITNTSFAVTQGTAANLNATVVGTGTFAVQADTELPAAAALADGAANPTTPTVGAAGLVYNGTTWDRIDGANVFDGNAATTYSGVVAVKQVPKRINNTLASTLNSTTAVDVNGASTVTLSIGTASGTGTITIEGTADNTNWGAVECYDIFADLWVSGQNISLITINPPVKVFSILSGGLRQVRVKVTTANLAGNINLFWSLDNTQEFIAGIDTGAAPHNFGYTLVHKDAVYTSTQTSTALWTPSATTKKFAVTDISVTTGGTTAGVVTIYDAAAATAYSAGTTPAVFRGEFAPSTTSRPGVVKSFNVPYVSTTANNVLLVTTSAAINPLYIQVNGYEI